MKYLTLLCTLIVTGCASWYTSPDELAEMEARRIASVDTGNCRTEADNGFYSLRCDPTAPAKDCEKSGYGVFVCGTLREDF